MDYHEFEYLVKSRFPPKIFNEEFCVDLYDICEIGELIRKMPARLKNLTDDDVEDFLLDFEVQVVMHLNFHLKSIKPKLKKMLEYYAKK